MHEHPLRNGRSHAPLSSRRAAPKRRRALHAPPAAVEPAPRSPEPGGARRGAADEFEALSPASRSEIEQLVDVLEAVKQGDFSVRLSYRKDGILSRAGDLLNDIIGELLAPTNEVSRSLEEKEEQLQLVSRYKSEFLANMSHELRTPLNSLLILSKMLAENRNGNLTADQVKFATTVHTSGNELLSLINEILDLSRVEAGKMPIEAREAPLDGLRGYLQATFRHVAEQKGLAFDIEMPSGLPETIHTDATRLRQILKNLVSNAFKFTEHGSVTVRVSAGEGRGSAPALAFAVRDTGIGIPSEKQELIFEAFQQADGTTSRKYGGAGLGLTISREIARLLGGSIEVESAPGAGSTFTLKLPQRYAGAEAPRPADTPVRPEAR